MLRSSLKIFTTLFILLLVISSSASQAKLELAPLMNNVNMWESNARDFSNRFDWLAWDDSQAEDSLTSKAKNMTLWGEKVDRVELLQTDRILSGLSIEILNQDHAILSSSHEFKKIASEWKLRLDKKLGSKGKVVPTVLMGSIRHTRIAWNCEGGVVVLSANIGAKPDRLSLSFYERENGLALLKLKGQQDLDYMAAQEEKTAKKEEVAKESNDAGLNDSADSGASKDEKEIRAMIREISDRKAPNGISREVQAAVNMLNVYRYLCGVSYDVKADKSMIKAAEDAAQICNKNNTLSHDFGHSTDKCNLSRGTKNLTMESSVSQYMQDNGDHNRAQRGHRRWCINHKMGKTGFGIDGSFSAMYSLDQSGRGSRDNYSYPGHGLFPIEYLHGSGWSYYLVSGKVPSEVEVEVWKLRSKEDKLPSWSTEPDGRKLPCSYVNSYKNTIVFEPDSKPITKKGYYLVRLKGSGLKEQYLVKLY